jgi:glyoxylase-like metal-dependent hydrolase (beta-lactamase superfamily II)
MEGEKNPQIIILFDGYSKDEESSMLANCTCTLIKGPPNIIIDTMTAWDGNRIIEALSHNGINCNDINFVICTHGHSDHIGCNYLFPKATHIVGFCVSFENRFYAINFKSGEEYIISDKIRVIPTPGHTLQDVSVIVDTGNSVVAITGDLFENEEDLSDDNIWKSAGSDSEHLQIINRKKILEIADYVVPGHGPMFKVQK